MEMETLMITTTRMFCFFLSFMFLYLLLTLSCRFLKQVWWDPTRIQSAMRMQGIRGPSYRFLHGNTKEITSMRTESMSTTPILDISHEMLPRLQPHIHSWTRLYGMNFVFWYGARAEFAVTEPELVKEVLSNKDGSVPKKVTQSYVDKFLGDGLIVSQGEKWIKIRKLANHAFHAESLRDMIPAMVASAEKMVERWSGMKEVEVFQEFKILTSEIISRTAFGSSYLEGKNIFDMLRQMGDIVSRNNFRIRFPWFKRLLKTSDDNEADRLNEGIRGSITKIIKKREEGVLDYGSDFLGQLLKAHHENDMSKKISVDDLIDECKCFYVAGHEPSSTSLTWAVLLLSIHTDWQDRARNEILELFGQNNPTPDGIGRMKTVSMIVNETLRLYPPAFNLTREVQKEVRLGKLIIPAKVGITLPILAVHHNTEIWGEDAHLFKPERFAEGVAKATRNNAYAFMPFGLGPRTCVGSSFAIAEMKIAVSMILQRYRLTLSPNYVHAPVHILTICPKYGLQVILQEL